MKIAAFHHGDINIASTRLRSIYLFDYLFDNNIKIFRNVGLLKSLSCKIIHFHMKYKPSDLIKLIIYRIFKKIVIFDVDDNPIFFKHKFFFIIMLNLASRISVDTKVRMLYLKKYTLNKKKIFVLRDIIDLEPNQFNKIKKKIFIDNSSFFWIGNRENYPSIHEFVQKVKKKPEIKLTIIANLDNQNSLDIKFSNIKFYNWRKNIAFDESNFCTYAIFNHTLNYNDNFKSENKMVLAIAAGMIPLVSDSPSYSYLAKKLDAEILIYNNFNDVFGIIKKIDLQWKSEFIYRAQKYIIAEYSNKVIFKKLIQELNL